CHTNATPQWADAKVRAWRTRDYQAPVLEVGRLVQAARSNEWTKLDGMLEYLARSNREPVVSASLLRLMVNCPDPRVAPAARARMAADASPLVRGAAAELLAYHRAERASLDALLAGCRDDFRLVRVRSAIALSGALLDGVAPEARAAFDKALAEYRASLDCRPDEWSSHYNIGNLHLDSGEPARAVPAFETAARLAPEQLMPWVNGAMAHARTGNMGASETWLRTALQRDPTNAVANFNLGLAVAERGDLAEAEKLLRQAVNADPRMAEAAFNLGVLVGRRDPAGAAEWTAKAAALRPRDGRYAYTHAFFLRQAGRVAEARGVLEEQMKSAPVNPETAVLLGELYEAGGQRDDAKRVYQRALEDPSLPADAVRFLRQKLRSL
ncbi:MAG: tetratricopeptide repeat protein, partial [Lentisphaerae bacterium]|nr:tetratricopeptide repeat protein [Lentisphaerota bacterium]